MTTTEFTPNSTGYYGTQTALTFQPTTTYYPYIDYSGKSSIIDSLNRIISSNASVELVSTAETKLKQLINSITF